MTTSRDRGAPIGWYGGSEAPHGSASTGGFEPPLGASPRTSTSLDFGLRLTTPPKATRITIGIWLIAGSTALSSGALLLRTLTGDYSLLPGGGVGLLQLIATLELIVAAALIFRKEVARRTFIVTVGISVLFGLVGLFAGDGTTVGPSLVINVLALIFLTRQSVANTFA